MRLRVLIGWSALVGAGGALTGFAYLALLHGFEHVLGPEAHSPLAQLGILTAAGAAISLLVRWLGSTGDMELLVDDIHVLEGKSDVRRLGSMLPVSLICIASGGGAGPEAPLVQTTGTLSQSFAERWRLAPADRRSLTIAGMAAAFTVLFGAPVGAALFALEILHRRGLQYYEALLPAVVASLVGYAVYVTASGLGLTPVWSFAAASEVRASDLAWAAAMGAVGAVLALAFSGAIRAFRFALTPVPEPLRPVVGGVALGLLAFASPYALTYGKYQLDPALATGGTVAFFALVAAAKLAGTSITVASGWRGGFIIPLFFIGATCARALHLALPSAANEAILAAALMAAINTGVTKTPLGSTLVVAKMTGLSLLPTTATAATVALLLTHRTGLLPSQRERE
jgi:H+/Cl- antiporter ClcA